MRTARAAERGFTLLEVLVALVVAGLVVAGAFAALGFTGDAWARVRDERGTVLGSAAARLTLERWLRGATLAAEAVSFHGERGFDASFPSDRLTFAVGDAGPLRPGPHRIRLWVDSDPATPRTGLSAELTPLRATLATRAETLSVAPAALGLSVRYRTRVNGKPEWLPKWTERDRLPTGVEVTLLAPPLPEGSGGLPPLLRIPLVVALPLGGG